MCASVGFCAVACMHAANARLVEQQMQRHHCRDRDRQYRQALRRDTAPKTWTSVAATKRGKRLRLRAVKILDGLFQKQRQRDGRNDQRQYAVLEHRIDDDELEQQPKNDERQRDADQRRQPKRRAEIHRRQDEESRQHDEFALGEIDRLRRLPQQRESDGDESVDRSRRKAGNQKLNKGSHRHPPLGFRLANAPGGRTPR